MADPAVQYDLRDGDVLAMSGALTFATAAAGWRDGASKLQQGRPAWLDLAAVSHADSAGLALVLALLASAREQGRELRVRHAPAGLQALARVCDAEPWIQG